MNQHVKWLKDRSPRILVVGDVMMDRYLWGSSERISPEAPVPVVDVVRELDSLGGAANVMNNLLMLGARVTAVAVVGQDKAGSDLRTVLQHKGIATSGIITEPGRQTPEKTRVLVTHQQILRFDKESTVEIQKNTELALLNALFEDPEPLQAVLISDYDKGLLTTSLTQAIIQWARQRSLPVLVDPKGTNYLKYRGATLITPNRKEAAQWIGFPIDSDASLRQAGESLKQKLDLRHAIITLSEEGLALFSNGMTLVRSVAKEVYDVTGAGDTVLATLGFALACDLPIEEAAQLANRAAAVVVGKLGSATTTVDEMLGMKSKTSITSDPEKPTIHSSESIEPIAQELQRQGQRIVFTNGCFDLLHRGHVKYLQASRRCGDVLIVGINSNKSVQQLKGPQRPVVDEEDRAYIVNALACVDYVVLFEGETPYQLIHRIRPDVLTKGSDYSGKPIVGSDAVEEVRLISFLEGRSTSQTIDHIQKAA